MSNLSSDATTALKVLTFLRALIDQIPAAHRRIAYVAVALLAFAGGTLVLVAIFDHSFRGWLGLDPDATPARIVGTLLGYLSSLVTLLAAVKTADVTPPYPDGPQDVASATDASTGA